MKIKKGLVLSEIGVLLVFFLVLFSISYEKIDFAEKISDMYRDVEIEYWPEVRWWLAEGLNTDETLKRNIRQIYDSGFGAVEFLAMPEEGGV